MSSGRHRAIRDLLRRARRHRLPGGASVGVAVMRRSAARERCGYHKHPGCCDYDKQLDYCDYDKHPGGCRDYDKQLACSGRSDHQIHAAE